MEGGTLPDNLGKYELQDMLGRGSSAQVYRALDRFSGAEVALKLISPQVFRDPEHGEAARHQFLNEASLAGQLDHPHIVAIHEAAATHDSAYVAMELVDGRTLAEHMAAQGMLSAGEAIEIAFKCCGALDYAYRKGIIHRDIKPANIMVGDGSQVKVADFGSAWLRHSDVTQTVHIGTPAYMSPEQVKGDALTHSTDMYCLGAVLYELLCGRAPYAAGSIAELITKIVGEEPSPPSRWRDGIPPELDAIVLKAMAKSPAARYESWAEFALALADVGRLSVFRRELSDSFKFESMRGLKMLERMDDAGIWQLVHAGRWLRIPAQTVLIREEEMDERLFLLVDGNAKVTKNGRLLNVVGGGECFGEMAYIREGALRRQATVESMTEMVEVQLERAALGRLGSDCQLDFMRALVINLAERLGFANERLAQPAPAAVSD